MRRILALVLLLVASVACSDDTVTGPTIPDITGEWVGSWTIVAQGSGLPSPTTTECSGSISITTQTGREFSGSALIDGDRCSFPPLPFEGDVEDDGSLRFTLNLVADCTITEGSSDFTGSVEGDSLAVTYGVSAECESGPFSASISFTGSRAS
jgi:hypothetical protein